MKVIEEEEEEKKGTLVHNFFKLKFIYELKYIYKRLNYRYLNPKKERDTMKFIYFSYKTYRI